MPVSWPQEDDALAATATATAAHAGSACACVCVFAVCCSSWHGVDQVWPASVEQAAAWPGAAEWRRVAVPHSDRVIAVLCGSVGGAADVDETLVFVHGVGGSSRVFEPLVQAAADAGQVRSRGAMGGRINVCRGRVLRACGEAGVRVCGGRSVWTRNERRVSAIAVGKIAAWWSRDGSGGLTMAVWQAFAQIGL